jgi:hypothetical protein
MATKFQKAVAERTAAAKATKVDAAERPPLRPEVREDDPRARAAARIAQLREHAHNLDEGTDEFYVPPSLVPDGWSYEWKRHKIWNQEDPSYTVQLAQEGWEEVPLHRNSAHEAMMPRNWPGKTIERKGMILMERPTEISNEIRRMELRRARQQVQIKEAQLAGTPEGTMSRDADPRVRPNIKKTFDMPIPEDL